MIDIQELFRRQAEWQKSRKSLSWSEKIRMVERMRDDVLKLRATKQEPGPKDHG
jgi:hypothetical protein